MSIDDSNYIEIRDKIHQGRREIALKILSRNAKQPMAN